MELRRSVLFFLLVTVLAPIVLYTDTLGVYFTPSSSRNEFVEDVSTFTFAGEVRPLNVLPQESSTSLKEPLGLVYSGKSVDSSSNSSDSSSGENSRITRQLTEESAEDRTTNSSILSSSGGSEQSSDENPIRQVIDMVHGAENKESNKPKLSEDIGIGGGQNDVKEEFRS
ncbi:hypothetical protein CDL12_14108 [Handroanthus impetiginosus]|uniref:Uncharacterized protein n=1 Tax=Handroanthus impetiginosus TaxID=429701 RepID=A0A2G9H6X9_9LAMI|nr:hypothetical protein CDL12_14108 [Handroanthus impetiginosus]